MRDVNESTNARVAWFAIFAAIICVALAALQLLYLNKVRGGLGGSPVDRAGGGGG